MAITPRTVALSVEIADTAIPLKDLKDSARKSLAYLGTIRTVMASVMQPSKGKKAARRK